MDKEVKPRKIFKVDLYDENGEYMASMRLLEDEPVNKIWSVFGTRVTDNIARIELKPYK